jgi:hypothetical protein
MLSCLGMMIIHEVLYPGAQKTTGLPGDEWAFWNRDSAPRAGVESRIKGTTPVKPWVGLHCLNAWGSGGSVSKVVPHTPRVTSCTDLYGTRADFSSHREDRSNAGI